MSDTVQYSLMIMLYIFEGFCVRYLFDALAKPRFKKVPVKYIPAVTWVIIQLSAMIIFVNDSSKNLVMKLVFCALILFLSCIWLYKGSLAVKAFMVILATAIHQLIFFSAYSLVLVGNLLQNALAEWVIEGSMDIDIYMILSQLSIYLSTLLVEIGRGMLFYFSIKAIVKYSRPEGISKEIFYYLLPAAGGILTAVMIRLLLFTTENGQLSIIYDKYPSLYLLVPMINLTLLGATIYSFRSYQNIKALEREKTEKAVMENQIAQMQSSVLEMEQLYDGMRSFRHDIKNQMTVLNSLLCDEKLSDNTGEKIRLFFKDMENAANTLYTRANTGDPVSNAIIERKFSSAKSTLPGIVLDCEEFTLTDKINIHPYDIGIILGNTLDNAVEACERLRQEKPDEEIFITLRSYIKGRMFFIEVENSFDGRLLIDENTGLPLSQKPQRDIHGIGLYNIKSIAEKYGGTMDIQVKKSAFILSVMMKNKDIDDNKNSERSFENGL